RSEDRDDLSGPQQNEVAVAPEWRRPEECSPSLAAAAAFARAVELPAHLAGHLLRLRVSLLTRRFQGRAALGRRHVAHRGLRALRVLRRPVALQLLDRARKLRVLSLERCFRRFPHTASEEGNLEDELHDRAEVLAT